MEEGLPSFSSKLAFASLVRSHPYHSSSAVARSMIQRLEVDVADFAMVANGKVVERFVGLLDHECHAISREIIEKVTSIQVDKLSDSLARFIFIFKIFFKIFILTPRRLIRDLTNLRTKDAEFIRSSFSFLQNYVNFVALPIASDLAESKQDLKERLEFLLFRQSGRESTIPLDFLISSCLSSKPLEDLQSLNPYLTLPMLTGLQDVTCTVLLVANRVGQINRCLDEANSILNMIRSPEQLGKNVSERGERLAAGLIQKSESLAEFLLGRRHYMDEPVLVEEIAETVVAGSAMAAFDPRFLVFEFTWNILIRKTQVEV
jgi:hypothetical protein